MTHLFNSSIPKLTDVVFFIQFPMDDLRDLQLSTGFDGHVLLVVLHGKLRQSVVSTRCFCGENAEFFGVPDGQIIHAVKTRNKQISDVTYVEVFDVYIL